MRWLVLSLILLSPACSNDGGSDSNGNPTDGTVREGLGFPDVSRDVPADLPVADVSPDLGIDQAPPPDLPPPDLPPPDLPSPDLGPPLCSVYSHFTCTQSSSSTCSASCLTATQTYAITCISSFISLCSCIKNGSSVGTCSRVGTGCTPCQNAFSCCAAKF